MSREVARVFRSLADADQCVVVIVSYARWRSIADRVLRLEEGTFRELGAMAQDPVCGMAVEATVVATPG